MRVDDLESQAESGLSITPGTQKAAVLRVLVANPETAFTPTELADRADVPAANAPTVCGRLAEMGAASAENGHYYLPQDDERAGAVRRALGGAHQEAVAQQTADADERALDRGAARDDTETLSEAAVDAEVAAMNEDLPED